MLPWPAWVVLSLLGLGALAIAVYEALTKGAR